MNKKLIQLAVFDGRYWFIDKSYVNLNIYMLKAIDELDFSGIADVMLSELLHHDRIQQKHILEGLTFNFNKLLSMSKIDQFVEDLQAITILEEPNELVELQERLARQCKAIEVIQELISPFSWSG